MGEMKFKQRPREEQAEVDTEDDAKNASHNFGIDHEAFLRALTKPRVRVGNEWVCLKMIWKEYLCCYRSTKVKTWNKSAGLSPVWVSQIKKYFERWCKLCYF